MINDEDDKVQGIKQDDTAKEEERIQQNNDTKEERWGKQDDDKGMQWEFHRIEQDIEWEEEQGEEQTHGEEELLENSCDHYLHVYRYLPRRVGYPRYRQYYQGYRNHWQAKISPTPCFSVKSKGEAKHPRKAPVEENKGAHKDD